MRRALPRPFIPYVDPSFRPGGHELTAHEALVLGVFVARWARGANRMQVGVPVLCHVTRLSSGSVKRALRGLLAADVLRRAECHGGRGIVPTYWLPRRTEAALVAASKGVHQDPDSPGEHDLSDPVSARNRITKIRETRSGRSTLKRLPRRGEPRESEGSNENRTTEIRLADGWVVDPECPEVEELAEESDGAAS